MQPHILMVEDNHSLRRLYSRTLERGGFRVTDAEDLFTARQYIAANRFDAIVCDIQLTDGLATDFMEEIHDMGTPILAISSDESYRTLCDELEIEAFMRKPIPTRLLVPSVKAILQDRKKHKEEAVA